jgi:hypothetical protein
LSFETPFPYERNNLPANDLIFAIYVPNRDNILDSGLLRLFVIKMQYEAFNNIAKRANLMRD